MTFTLPAASALVALACALTLAPAAARAQGTLAYAAKTVNLRAGPARDFPVVAVLPASMQLLVQGCLPDYTWCDVIGGGSRGWVYAGNISYPYQGSVVPLLDYGPAIGIGILGFVLNDYWHDHYRSRPWYDERRRWNDRPHYRPAPRRYEPPRDWRPQRPRPQEAAPIGPRPGPNAMPGVTPRPPRETRPDGRDRRDGERDWRRDDGRRDGHRDGRRDGPWGDRPQR